VLDAKTNFQLDGIKAGKLAPEIQRQLIENGVDLSEINFEGSDLERRVTNTGTNDAIVREFFDQCRKDAGGALPAKTIFFAMSHCDAMELLESFRRVRPDIQQRGMVEVIDSHMDRADKMLDDFKHKDMPRVAISVDMLDTGIDMPAIQNLVFAKPVFSQVKFWQMIGRGTRLWEDKTSGKKKDSFLIIDHWNNFAYFNMNPEGETPCIVAPLPVRLFRARLAKLELLRAVGTPEQITEAIGQLQSMLALLPIDDANAHSHAAEVEALLQAVTWSAMNAERIAHVSHTIAPLLRLVSELNLQMTAFELHVEQLALAWLENDTEALDKRSERISTDLKSLPVNLPQVRRQANQLAWMTSGGFWEHLDYERIMAFQRVFAPLMRYRQAQRRDVIKLTLPDSIVSRHWIIYGPSGEGAFADSYREQVEAQVRRLSEELLALNKLKRGDSLEDAELHTLADALNRPDLFITEENLREAYEQPNADLLALLLQELRGCRAQTHARRNAERISTILRVSDRRLCSARRIIER
jgi:type I restriction enzyme, R subunit